MARYLANVQATSNGSANTDDVFIELKAATGTTLNLKRVTVSFPATTAQDYECYIRVTRNSGAASFTSGTSFTPLKLRQTAPAATATCTVKNGTNGATVGTLTDTPIKHSVNTRGIFDYAPQEDGSEIECASAAYFEIVIQVSSPSVLVNVSCEWEE